MAIGPEYTSDPGATDGTDSTDSTAGFAGWLARRAEEVAGPAGHLALTGTHDVAGEDQQVPAAPGLWSSTGGSLSVRADAAAGLRINGSPVDGVVTVDAAAEPTIEAPGVTLRAFVRDGRHVVRTYEHAAPARKTFVEVDRYAYDPSWRLPARFDPHETPEAAAVAYQRDDVVREHLVLGVLSFDLDGQTHRLRAFEGHGGVWFVFADATTGVSTYRPGRFCEVEQDEHGDFVIDFNRAYLPPCAFSHHYNCPLPPPENVLSVAVPAGEKALVSA